MKECKQPTRVVWIFKYKKTEMSDEYDSTDEDKSETTTIAKTSSDIDGKKED